MLTFFRKIRSHDSSNLRFLELKVSLFFGRFVFVLNSCISSPQISICKNTNNDNERENYLLSQHEISNVYHIWTALLSYIYAIYIDIIVKKLLNSTCKIEGETKTCKNQPVAAFVKKAEAILSFANLDDFLTTNMQEILQTKNEGIINR